MTVKQAIKYTTSKLEKITDEPRSEAKIIVAHLAKTSPNRLPFVSCEISEYALDRMLEKRLSRMPLQYILGKWWFYGYEFFVGDGVLIPRQDTELLVETALELLKDKPDAQVCDLCSGSGCIAISLAKERQDLKVTAVEKFDKAYGYLTDNIKYNDAKNVNPIKADVTAESFGMYDLIVSNPPYIPVTDWETLSPEVQREPETALLGGDDGLDFYRTITSVWKTALKPGGRLAFEVGIGEADAVAKTLKSENFSEITVKNDISGIQRVVFGTLKDI